MAEHHQRAGYWKPRTAARLPTAQNTRETTRSSPSPLPVRFNRVRNGHPECEICYAVRRPWVCSPRNQLFCTTPCAIAFRSTPKCRGITIPHSCAMGIHRLCRSGEMSRLSLRACSPHPSRRRILHREIALSSRNHARVQRSRHLAKE